MKPMHMVISPGMNLSFRVAHEKNNDLFRDSSGHVPLHFHKEFEIMAILKGDGSQVVGSSIENYEGGEVIFIGPNVTHGWLGELKPGSKDKSSEYIYTCFEDKSFGSLFSQPEMQQISQLLKNATQGIKYIGSTALEAIVLLKRTSIQKNADRIISMLELLHLLANSTEGRVLQNKAMAMGPDRLEADRINKVFKYLLEHYNKDITVTSVADHIGMSPNAFSRFFKTRTYKHFVEYLNEVRITNATRLISDCSINISDVAYQCGYNSISNFNRQFKRYTKYTPFEYKQKLLKAL